MWSWPEIKGLEGQRQAFQRRIREGQHLTQGTIWCGDFFSANALRFVWKLEVEEPTADLIVLVPACPVLYA